MPEFKVLKKIDVEKKDGVVDPKITRERIERAISKEVLDVGCYVFAAKSMKRRGKIIPVYVGQTKKSFATECLTPATRAKVDRYLKSHAGDELFLYLIAHPRAKGVANGTAIDEIESFLISRAAEVNPKVENRRNVKPTAWSIHGVLGGGRGRRSEGAKAVAEMLDLEVSSTPAETPEGPERPVE